MTLKSTCRALLIPQAVANEAERRGLHVLEAEEVKVSQGQPAYTPVQGHIWLITEHGDYFVTITVNAGAGGRSLG